ncbi:hypothetical protein NQ315_017218 [Exocentrus adspersus]|uniref:Transposase n=1 Tax=Exocentrus adspersus TaxID=1586481 RepID=A0AAV8V4V7_9CUCU|nr:hypothetical protein NQ315_017218 [Exocentrus adspersus]
MPKVLEGQLKYSKKYSEDDVKNALNMIADGVPLREAARKFNIPRATLQFRRSDKFSKTTFGPRPVLSEQGKCLGEGSVKAILDKYPRENPFTDNFPHDGWYKAFLRRHPELAVRTPEGVTAASANVSEKDIRCWFQQIGDYIVSKGYQNVLDDPRRIFNSDETSFNLCPKNSKVLAPRGSRNVYEVEHASSKQTITVLFSFSAAGLTAPPLIIYPGKRLRGDIAESVPKHWGIGLSDTGWRKAEVLYDYIKNVFYPYLKAENVTFPIILYLDGHSTHLTYQLSELCKSLDIILICLYPNATRILQPADVGAFKPLKTGWKKAVIDWRKDNLNESLTKEKFAPILQKVYMSRFLATLIEIMIRLQPITLRNCKRTNRIVSFVTILYVHLNIGREKAAMPDAIDFSKCLGGEKKDPLENPERVVVSDKVLSFDHFKRILVIWIIYTKYGYFLSGTESESMIVQSNEEPQQEPSTVFDDLNIENPNHDAGFEFRLEHVNPTHDGKKTNEHVEIKTCIVTEDGTLQVDNTVETQKS